MRIAIFTIVHNEAFFLPMWIKHYSRDFINVYVLDHDTTDGSTNALPQHVTVVKVHNPYLFDHHWLNQTVRKFQLELLQQYDIAVFAEADEFLVCPNNGNLHEYIVSAFASDPKKQMLRAIGIEVIETDDGTHKMVREPNYDKVLISNVECRWQLGFHELMDPMPRSDSDLLLVHLHRVSKQRFLDRRTFKGMDYASNDDPTCGVQNKMTDIQRLGYYHRDQDMWEDLLPGVQDFMNGLCNFAQH